jgi:hypothetical protein
VSPSYAALAADNRLGFVTWRVYICLERHYLDHVQAREIKIWVLADRLKIGNTQVCKALNWLAEHGYIREHERGSRGVRRFTLVWSVDTKSAA